MGTGRTDEFRKDAVRIALTSGLTRKQVADDLGLGRSLVIHPALFSGTYPPKKENHSPGTATDN